MTKSQASWLYRPAGRSQATPGRFPAPRLSPPHLGRLLPKPHHLVFFSLYNPHQWCYSSPELAGILATAFSSCASTDDRVGQYRVRTAACFSASVGGPGGIVPRSLVPRPSDHPNKRSDTWRVESGRAWIPAFPETPSGRGAGMTGVAVARARHMPLSTCHCFLGGIQIVRAKKGRAAGV
jgi:hypothetical protein